MNPLEKNGQQSLASPGDHVLITEDLTKHFESSTYRKSRSVHAVCGVNLSIARGEIVGVVGESGSGKTTLGRLIAGLISPTSGKSTLVSHGLGAARSAKNSKSAFAACQMVFQDPSRSLNPRLQVGRSIAEPLRIPYRRPEARAAVAKALRTVLLPEELGDRYPHELSGGQQQRAAIARATIARPPLVVYDEAVSSMDTISQLTVARAIRHATESLGVAGLFITHDIGLVSIVCDRVAVMYAGRIVELAAAEAIYRGGLKHPYSQLLIGSVPISDPRREAKRRKNVLGGSVPDPTSPPAGCRFHPRCPIAEDVCQTDEPHLEVSKLVGTAACHFSGTRVL